MSEIPKYQSISNDLRRRIADGEFSPGERLPAQHALAEEYGVTVMTLRQGVADLEAAGLLAASKGRGTFVTEPPSVRYDLDHLWSFTQEMTHQGVDVSTVVVGVDLNPDVAVADRVRKALDLMPDEQVVELVRRRSVAGQPVVLQRSYLAAPMWQRVRSADFAAESLYDVLEDRCGVLLDRASETIRAVGLNTADAVLLGVEPGGASFESIRVSRAVNGVPFLFDRALIVGAATEIRTERTARSMQVEYRTLSSS